MAATFTTSHRGSKYTVTMHNDGNQWVCQVDRNGHYLSSRAFRFEAKARQWAYDTIGGYEE